LTSRLAPFMRRCPFLIGTGKKKVNHLDHSKMKESNKE